MRAAAVLTALGCLLAAAPAQATQGLLCRPESGARPRISLVIGAGGIAGASIDERGHWVTVGPETGLTLAQAWIDREQVLADIVGPSWERVAQLRVRFDPPAPRKPRIARGTLTLRGRTYVVRCQED
jgi:hypothetical protein